MTNIGLQNFCGKLPHVNYHCIQWPIHIGQWTIATDGHIAVRVPRLPNMPETLGVPSIISAIFDKHSDEDQGELPLFTPPNGRFSCADCKGCGLELSEEGSLTPVPCSHCDGSGSVPIIHHTSVEIEGTILSARYLEMIRSLPFPKLCYGSWPGPYVSEDQPPVSFIFEGGIGLLMPMRRQHNQHVRLGRPGASV